MDHRAEGYGSHRPSTFPGCPWLAQPLPEALDVSDIQDGVGVAGTQAQALVGSVIHLHVAAPTRGAHEEPVQEEWPRDGRLADQEALMTRDP